MLFPVMSGGFCIRRMKSTSLLRVTCYSVATRVTARQRAGIEDTSPTAQPLSSLLLCGTRALLRIAAPLPLAHKPLVGLFGMARDRDLPIAQLFDIVSVGRAALVAFSSRLASLQLH